MKTPVFRVRPSWMKRLMFIALLILMFFLSFTGMAFGVSGGEHGENSGTTGWVKTDTYRVMNFLVLAAVLFFLLRKPATQALNGRIQGIRDQLNELESKKKKAEAKLVQYQERLSLLDKEAEKIIAEYINQGKEAKAQILREAEVAATKIEDQARRNIEHEFKLAKEKLQMEILDKALAKAERALKEKITPGDQDRLVDEYLEKVVIH